MLNKLRSFQLNSISTRIHALSFKREFIPESKDVKLEVSFSLSMQDEKDDGECFLTLSYQSGVIVDGNDKSKTPFSLDLVVDYRFSIIDKDNFYSMSEDERTNLLSNIVYMTFRRKLMASLADAGLSSIKVPLNIDKFRESFIE